MDVFVKIDGYFVQDNNGNNRAFTPGEAIDFAEGWQRMNSGSWADVVESDGTIFWSDPRQPTA